MFPTDLQYVPWDFNSLVSGVQGLIASMGNIINVGLRGFLIITAVYFIVKIGSSFFN